MPTKYNLLSENLNDGDASELEVMAHEGKVKLVYPEKIIGMGFSPCEARALIRAITECLDDLEEEEPT